MSENKERFGGYEDKQTEIVLKSTGREKDIEKAKKYHYAELLEFEGKESDVGFWCYNCEYFLRDEKSVTGWHCRAIDIDDVPWGCCFKAQTKIMTDKGEKYIKDIAIGDMVLTHKDRFMPVIRKYIRNYDDEFVKLKFTGLHSDQSIIGTKEHPVLTKKGWLPLNKIKIGDMLFILAKHCISCKKSIPYSKKGSTCSSLKCAEYNASRKLYSWFHPDYREKMSQHWRKINQRMLMANKHPFQLMTLEERLKNEERIMRIRGYNNRKGSNLEMKVKDILHGLEINFVHQYKIRINKPSITNRYNFTNRWVDFALVDYKILIECDGEEWHMTDDAKRREREKDEWAIQNGWIIYHLSGREIQAPQFLVLIQNILSQNHIKPKQSLDNYIYNTGTIYDFIPIAVKTVSIYKDKPRPLWHGNINYKKVYNLEVENDNSYVANGIIVHNCELHDLKPELRKFD